MKKISSIVFIALLSFGIAKAQTAFYTQDFSTGIPGGWVNTSTDASNVAHTGTWKVTTTGSNGSYSNGFKLNSPTAANGFVIFDSDSLDSKPGGAGHGNDLAPQQATLTTSAINCTGHNNIILSFYHGYYLYGGDLYVYVSNGSAVDTFFISQNYEAQFVAGGIITGTTVLPQIQERLDITNVAANQAAVTVSFNWVNAYYYFWMIDDINLLDAGTSDLKITRAGLQGYSIYPISELDSMQGYARVTEQGSTPQPDSRINTLVKFNNSTVVFNDTSALGVTLPVGVDSPLIASNNYLPISGKGRYSVVITTFSDSIDAYLPDNIDTSSFNVSDSVFAMDRGPAGGAWPLNDASLNPAISGDMYLNFWFTVPNADTITSVTTSFAGGTGLTAAGSQVQATVYSLDPTLDPTQPGSYVRVISTEVKTLAAGDISTSYGTIKPVSLKINNASGAADAAILQPGYYAVGLTALSGTVYMHSPQNLVYGNYTGLATGGLGQASQVILYRNVFGYIRLNFGAGANILQASFTRTPGVSPLRVFTPVTFVGSTNGTGSANTQYSWTVNGQTSGIYQTYSTQTFKDTFDVADSFNVCLTVTDGGNSASTCSWVKVRDFGVGINEIAALDQIALVPNPTTGRVNISCNDLSGTVSVTVVNMLGDVVRTFSDEANGSSFSKTYDLSALSGGIYLIKIANGGDLVTRRLSISK